MEIDSRAKGAIDSVLALIETGKLPGPASYGTVAVLRDGAGFSLGLHQATDGSDTADQVLIEYISLGGSEAAALEPYLPRLLADESTRLNPRALEPWALGFMEVFRRAGYDPLMAEAQRRVFDRLYWQPSVALCRSLGLREALTALVVYDAWIQSGAGGVARNRMRFAGLPPSRGGEERDWTEQFLRARHSWLLGFTCADAARQAEVRRSSYRTAGLIGLLETANWSLARPFRFRGVEVR